MSSADARGLVGAAVIAGADIAAVAFSTNRARPPGEGRVAPADGRGGPAGSQRPGLAHPLLATALSASAGEDAAQVPAAERDPDPRQQLGHEGTEVLPLRVL